MSDDKDIQQDLHRLEELAALERKKKEVLGKELQIRERKADLGLEKIKEGDRAIEIARNTDYGQYSDEEVASKQKDNSEYMSSAKSKMEFINAEFDRAIPFYRKNLILVGGKTGEGKSTTVANIIRGMIGKKNSNTGKLRRILVLTNEEKAEDVYNRVTCLIKGWHYVNHDMFTEEQVQTFNDYIKMLSQYITVIDDTYNGGIGCTTTIEGVCQIFDNLLINKEYYDVVLIDYYQNITESLRNPTLADWQVQAALVRKLDRYKNVYPAPIVILAQVKPPDADGTPFKFRIEGRKSILNVATCCIEMIANRDELCTNWVIHKSRFNQMVGEAISTGYENGAYVLYDETFRAKVAQMKAAQETKELDRQIGHMPVVQAEEEKDE